MESKGNNEHEVKVVEGRGLSSVSARDRCQSHPTDNKGAAVRRLTAPSLRCRSGRSPSSAAERQRYALEMDGGFKKRLMAVDERLRKKSWK